jgi:transposase
VPETIGEAKTRIQEAEIESMEPLTEGYRVEECRSEYGDVEQRWLVVYSEEAEERARESAREKVQKEHEEEVKTFSELKEGEYACREDAEQDLEEFEEGLQASEFARKQVTRATRYTLEESSSPGGEGNRLEKTGEVVWLVGGSLVPSEERKARLLKRESLFIVATNELDEEKLSAEEMLEGYKGQLQVERGPELSQRPPAPCRLVVSAEGAADYGFADDHDAVSDGLRRARMAHPGRSPGPGPDVPGPERESDSAPDRTMGI